MQGLAHVTVPDVCAVSCLVVGTLRRHLEADVYFLPKQLDEQVSKLQRVHGLRQDASESQMRSSTPRPVSNNKKQYAATGILNCLALGYLSTITASNSEDFPSVCQDVYGSENLRGMKVATSSLNWFPLSFMFDHGVCVCWLQADFNMWGRHSGSPLGGRSVVRECLLLFDSVDVMSVTVVRMTVARLSLNRAYSVSHQRKLRRHKLKGP